MLTLDVVMSENFDDSTQQFVDVTFPLQLEHSLLSLSKWEAEYEKPFLGDGQKTNEEAFSYVHAMVLTPDVPAEVFANLSANDFEKINAYINGKNTATTFHELSGTSPNREIITAEIIINWVIACKIPLEWAERQHLSKLFSTIRTINAKNQPPKKMPRRDMLAERKRINDQRRAEMGTRG